MIEIMASVFVLFDAPFFDGPVVAFLQPAIGVNDFDAVIGVRHGLFRRRRVQIVGTGEHKDSRSQRQGGHTEHDKPDHARLLVGHRIA